MAFIVVLQFMYVCFLKLLVETGSMV